MQEPEFINFLQRLCFYYGKKDGKDKTRNNLHFNKVKFIPGGQMLFDIFDAITNEYDYFPRNLPKAIKTAWDQWKAANPDKMQREGQHMGCQYCVKGWIHYVIYEKGETMPYRHVAVCAHCRGHEYTSLPKYTIERIQQMGGEIY